MASDLSPLSRIITISVKLEPPENLIYELKSVAISIYNHNVRCVVRSPGLRSHKSFSLKNEEHCCLAMLQAPIGEPCFIHTSVFINDPLPLVCPGACVQSRFMGYHIQEIGEVPDNLYLELVVKHFERYGLFRSSVSF